MAETRWPVTFTKRSISAPSPIRHAGTSKRNGKRTTSKFTALCGAPIAWGGHRFGPEYAEFTNHGKFDPEHPRACPNCARVAIEKIADE